VKFIFTAAKTLLLIAVVGVVIALLVLSMFGFVAVGMWARG
jgi:hypothetical protein